jgi:predicted amidophosphoribosyltransferase
MRSEEEKNQRRNLYYWERKKVLRETGRCMSCGKPNDREGRWYCTPCSIKFYQMELLKRLRYASEGLCIDCAKPHNTGRLRCEECLKKDSGRHIALYWKVKNQGICVVCHKRYAEAGSTRCPECKGKYMENYKRHRMLTKLFSGLKSYQENLKDGQGGEKTSGYEQVQP